MAGAAHSGSGGSSYAGTATYHATMTELADGDPLNNTLVYDEGLCNLADRTAWLKARAIDVGALFVTDGAGAITLTSSIGIASASVTATYVSLTLSAALTGFPLIAVSAIGGAAAADWRSVDYLVVGASEIRIYFFKSVVGVLTPMAPNAEIVSGSLLLLEV